MSGSFLRKQGAVFALIAWPGCSSPVINPSPYFDLVETTTASEEQWRSSGIHDYRFLLTNGYVETEIRPLWITVIDDRAVSVVDATTDQPILPVDPSQHLTLSDLFDLVLAAVDEAPFDIRAQFDPDLGYPVRIDINYEEMVVDEERFFVVESFEEL